MTIREATIEDLGGLVPLHYRTWQDTYRGIFSERELKVPTHEIREAQWRKNFQISDGSWFCFVAENEAGEMIGFASGRPGDHPDFAGELHKIYLLGEYQRMGIGARLLGHVVRRFLSRGVNSMWVYADGRNPSCEFYRQMGGTNLDEDPMLGNYGWSNLKEELGERCPED